MIALLRLIVIRESFCIALYISDDNQEQCRAILRAMYGTFVARGIIKDIRIRCMYVYIYLCIRMGRSITHEQVRTRGSSYSSTLTRFLDARPRQVKRVYTFFRPDRLFVAPRRFVPMHYHCNPLLLSPRFPILIYISSCKVTIKSSSYPKFKRKTLCHL